MQRNGINVANWAPGELEKLADDPTPYSGMQMI
jgi:hypothetical protein